MTGTQVFDRLARAQNGLGEQVADRETLARLAEQMVSASVTSGKMLRELRERMFPAIEDPEALAVAKTLRCEFEEWVAEAEDVFERARRLEAAGRPIRLTQELGDLIGITRAMLTITLNDHLRSLAQIRTGDTVSMEELRRELQLKRGG